MRFAAALLVASIVAVPGGALAQSGARPFDWTGFYIGGHGAYARTGASYENPATPTQSFDGGMLGAQIGYNFQFGRVVVGAEADISFGNSEDIIRDVRYIPYYGKVSQMGTVRARLGYDFNGFMPYITAGWMWDRMEQGSACPAGDVSGFCLVTGPFNVASTQTFSGWTLGGGAEYALGRHWSVKGEVLFGDLGKKVYTATVPVLGTVTGPIYQDFNYVARLGINYRF